jgi:hypothetical protein
MIGEAEFDPKQTFDGCGGLDASRFIACHQLMVHRRGIPHAPVCRAGLRRFACRQRLVSAFLSRPDHQAPPVMGVIALRKCTRTSKHRRKQGHNHEQTHRVPPSSFSLINVGFVFTYQPGTQPIGSPHFAALNAEHSIQMSAHGP